MRELSRRRYYLFNVSSSLLELAVVNVLGLITLPIGLSYWNVDRYGIWAIVATFTTYIWMTNIGINTAASVLVAKNESVNVKMRIIRRTLHLMLALSFLLLVALLLTNALLPNWVSVIGNIPPPLFHEASGACLILGISTIVSIPFSLLSASFIAFQRAYVLGLFKIGNSVGNLLNLLVTIAFKGNLITFALTNAIIALVINLLQLLYFWLFVYRREGDSVSRGQEPAVGDDSRYKSIVTTGLRFSVNGATYTIQNNVDNLIVAHAYNTTAVTPYYVVWRFYGLFMNLLSMVSGGLAPILGREYGRANWKWLNDTYLLFFSTLTVLGGLGWIGGIAFARDFIVAWTRGRVVPDLYLIYVFGFYAYLMSMVYINSGALNTFNWIKGTPIASVLEVTVKIVVAMLLVKRFGILGIPVATVLSGLAVSAWLLPVLLRHRSGGTLYYPARFVLRHLLGCLLPLSILTMFAELSIHELIPRLGVGLAATLVYCIASYLMVPIGVKILIKKQFLDRLSARRSS